MTVARELVGCTLLIDAGTPEEVRARIVEVEAYLGTDDEASHAHRGPTPRAAIMFGEPGRLYVYLSYGVHHCANLVTEVQGRAGAVLLRAARVEAGEPAVRRRRRPETPAAGLLRGPGNLCSGLGIGGGDNGIDVCAPGGRLAVLPGRIPVPLAAGPRVGITRNADPLLRFAWSGDPAVSAPRLCRSEGA
ncbi:MAG: DNA-3-methyladenine glycosylase [Chloroflexota bacterium]|nr:DNA-3-methyladenine glycosylase [Chloroflexota bacterium]